MRTLLAILLLAGFASRALAADDFLTDARRWSSFRTDSSTWSDEGALGAKWGMGPVDVRRSHPSLEFVMSESGGRETQAGLTEEVIQGLKASLRFRFLQGRLVEIAIRPPVGGSVDSLTQESLERFWTDWWKWRRSIVEILREGYGAPLCAPSEYTLRRLCDAQAHPPGCGRMEDVEKLFRWVWRTKRSEVVLTGAAVPTLTYRDLAAMASVARSEQAAIADYARKQEAAKAAQRSQLTDGATQRGGEAENPSPTRDEQPEDNTPPEIKCAVDTTYVEGDATVPKGEWSRFGWDRFRWGMGPGDVRALLEVRGPNDVLWDAGPFERQTLTVGTGLKAFGETLGGQFHFSNGRLASISTSLACGRNSPLTPSLETCGAWAARASAAYSKRAGRPRCDREKEEDVCTWSASPDVWFQHGVFGRGERFQVHRLTWANPADNEMPAPPEFAARKSNSKEWSKGGWLDFRWGMGPADVIGRAKASGVIKAMARPWCVVSRFDKTKVSCALDATSHKLTLLGRPTRIVFEFSEGRLWDIQLELPKSLDSKDCGLVHEGLLGLLTDKYGGAVEGLPAPGKKSYVVGWSTDGTKVRLFGPTFIGQCLVTVAYSNANGPPKAGAARHSADRDGEKL